MNLRAIFDLVKVSFGQYQRDHGSRLAASLAFYSAISIAPLLATLNGLMSAAIGQEAARNELLNQVTQLMGPQAAEFVSHVITSNGATSPASSSFIRFIEVLLMLWGSTNVFLALKDSLNLIWNVRPVTGTPLRSMFRKRLFGFGLVIALGFLILVSLVFSAGIAILLERADWLAPNAGWILMLANLWFTLFGSAFLFGLLYKTIPDVEISWSVAWLGAVVTAMLFTLGTFALKVLLGGQGAPYGATGSLIIFLLWVYYSAQIVFFGAELTQVYSESRDETPKSFRWRGGRDIVITDPTESP